ncbi:TolC family protein [Rhodopirellula baltica]|uniref:TolC family protein n=1 Tax=Rhodopirellula baltica TaxID=265606 RepID=UPI001F016E6F|nr:TolC family protein [Rhodopirellula baltica]
MDPAIQDSGFLFGQRGEAAALSDFDSQLQISSIWGRNETIQNNRFLSGGILPGDALVEETAQFTTSLDKNLRSGARASVFHTWDYDASNRDDLLYSSVYRGTLGAVIRQPLLAGAGRNYTDVAGPPGDLLRGVTGVSQGILIAKNESLMAQFELQGGATRLLHDVESAYWDLSSAMLDVEVVAKAVSQISQYRSAVEARKLAGADRQADDLLQLEAYCLEIESLAEQSEYEVEQANQRLARLLGFSPDDAPWLVPNEIPSNTRINCDSESMLADALSLRSEIAIQRLRVRNVDHQIRAAQSLLLPQLDAIARYQVNGFGDKLATETVPGPDSSIQSAYGNLFQGDHTGWQLGFQFSHNIGRRLERTRIRNLRLQGQKERVLLHEQTNEVEHELLAAIQSLENSFRLLTLSSKRMDLLQRRFDASLSRYEAGDEAADIVQLAEARVALVHQQIDHHDRQASYAQAISRLNYVSGRTLREYRVATITADSKVTLANR